MEDQFREQLYNNLNLRETNELIEIWRVHDSIEWTELAFDVIQQILINRLGELPAQNLPSDENNQEVPSDSAIANESMSSLGEHHQAHKNMACPMCKGENLVTSELGIEGMLGGTGQRVIFGSSIFGGKNIFAVACEDCGFIFLMLQSHAG